MIQKVPPASVTHLLRTACTFLREHPVFIPIIFWLGVVPRSSLELAYPLLPTVRAGVFSVTDLSLAIVELVFAYCSLAAILLVGKRLLKNKAGRKRSSLLSVLRESIPYFMPLVLTSLLRACITVYWTLFLVIPGLVYLVKTTFYALAMFVDDLQYRAALTHSKTLVTGRFWHVVGTLAALVLILIVPAELLILALYTWVTPLGVVPDFLSVIIGNTAEQIATVMLLLSMIVYYGHLTHAKAHSDAKKLRSA